MDNDERRIVELLGEIADTTHHLEVLRVKLRRLISELPDVSDMRHGNSDTTASDTRLDWQE
jgi:hypothetical protein